MTAPALALFAVADHELPTGRPRRPRRPRTRPRPRRLPGNPAAAAAAVADLPDPDQLVRDRGLSHRRPPAWWRLVEATVAEHATRRDHRANLLAYARLHYWRRWGDGSTSVPRAEAAELIGRDQRSVSRYRRWLADHGLLVTWRQGSTSATRRDAYGNRCALYLLTGPEDAAEAPVGPVGPRPAPLDGTPPEPLRHNSYQRTVTRPLSTERGEPLVSTGERSQTGRDKLAALCAAAGVTVGWVRRRAQAGGLGALTDGELRHVLTHAPDGSRWTLRAELRSGFRLIEHLLGHWRRLAGLTGVDRLRLTGVLPDVDALAAAAELHAAVRAHEVAAKRARDAAEVAASVPCPPEVVELRAELRRQREAARAAADQQLPTLAELQAQLDRRRAQRAAS